MFEIIFVPLILNVGKKLYWEYKMKTFFRFVSVSLIHSLSSTELEHPVLCDFDF